MQEELLESASQPLVLAGDGRNDSPGHSAQYLTYSLFDISRKKIMALEIVDCRETNLISVNMEKRGFEGALKQVTDKCMVSEVVTDAHVQIKALMSKYTMIGVTVRTSCYDIFEHNVEILI